MLNITNLVCSLKREQDRNEMDETLNIKPVLNVDD